MKVKNKTIIITDPCYIAKKEDWKNLEMFDWKHNKIQSSQISDYIWSKTGFGDGSGNIINNKCNTTYGTLTVDSGTFGVFLLDEILEYNPDALKELPKKCYCIINDFTGVINETQTRIDYLNPIYTVYSYSIMAEGDKENFVLVWK